VIRGIHVYAWNLLLVVLGVHLAIAFVVGAYKTPWEKVWVSGVAVALLVPLFIVTGNLLPWNQSGYWSTKVRLGIASSVPVAGDVLIGLLGAQTHVGIVTLTRFYVLHILFLPCALAAALACHCYLIRQAHRSGPDDQAYAGESQGEWLHHVKRGLTIFLVVAVVLGVASWQYPAPLGDPADLTDTSYVPKPEWWVLPLNQLVTAFKGPLTVFATAVIPGALVGSLLALPFLDRSPHRHPAKRRKLLLVAAGLSAVALGLSAMGYTEHYAPAGDRTAGAAAQGRPPAGTGK
jgi:ubiquinol-cytochrome c reductase cytochrome b subunit